MMNKPVAAIKADANPRIADVDALRGFALFGILQVNIMVFGSVFYGLPVRGIEQGFGFDDLVFVIISSLFAMKFYLLFSFLFGYSVTLQMRSAERAGEHFIPRFLRRQAGLLCIGLLHAALLYHGDILSTYALLGMLLLLWRNRPDRSLIKSAIILTAAVSFLWVLGSILLWFFPQEPDLATELEQAKLAYSAYSGSFLAVVQQHIAEMPLMVIVLLCIQAPCALAMFLLGFVAGRHEFLAQPQRYQSYLKPAIRAGLLIGLPFSVATTLMVLLAGGTFWEALALALNLLTAPLLTFAIIALMLQLFGTKYGAFWRDALAPAGRMALSNYLLQSLICGFIYYGYGFGLIDRTTNFTNALIACVIFIAQLFISRWWMQNFYYGPLEWLLRALTIARWPQLRKTTR